MRQVDARAIVGRMREHKAYERDDDLADYFTLHREREGIEETMTASGVRNWKQRGRMVPLDALLQFGEWEGVALDWLVWGDDPKYRRDAIAAAERQPVDLRIFRIVQALTQTPALARAVEAVQEGNAMMGGIIERLPQLREDQLDVVARMVELHT